VDVADAAQQVWIEYLGGGTIMIELTQDQARATKEDYDASPWTEEEMEALAWEAGRYAGWWEEMPEYDNYADTST
jgi:hypothetical protein